MPLLPVLVFPLPLSVFAFRCSSLLFAAFRCLWLFVVALSDFSLLFMSTTLHRSELKQMNENGKEKCSLLLFVARFGFGACFHLLLVALCCSSLLVFLFLR